MDQGWIGTLLPLAIVGAVFAFRFRNLSQPRPFRPERMWIAPALIGVMFAAMVLTMPPSPAGWAALLVGALVGGGIGWKRGHLMRLERDPATGSLTIRQSPAALLLIIGILVAKRLITAGTGINPGQGGGPPQAGTLILIDGLLGLALGMVLALNWTLWTRAKTVPHP